MSTVGPVMFLGVVANCARTAPATSPERSAAQNSARPATSTVGLLPFDVSSSAVGPPSAVRRDVVPSSRGGAVALVFVRNSYLTTQHVFVDNERRATVPPASEQSFEVPPGAHTITLSDSVKGDQNPRYVAEVFDAGLEYRYDVVAR
jgi:hypothetical protein